MENKETPEQNAQTYENTTEAQADELSVVEVDITGEKRSHRHHHSHSSSSGSKSRKRRRHKKHRGSEKKKMKRRTKVLLIILGAIVALAVAATAVFFSMRSTGKEEFTESLYKITAPKTVKIKSDGSTVEYNGKTYKYKKDAVNILFMGIDENSAETENAEIGEKDQADVILVMSIDLEQDKMTIVNIPRDIVTDVVTRSRTGGYSGIEKLPIAMSYAYGETDQECSLNTLDAVRKMFYNIPINAYLALELDGIAAINDSVGGVDVKCPEDVYKYGELIFEKGETYHLEGDSAERFVRLRNREVAEANLLRNERQKIYLKSFINKVIPMAKSDLSVPLSLYDTAKEYSTTNITTNGVTYLATELLSKGTPKLEMNAVPVDVKQVENHAENYIKETEFYELFLSVFYTEVDG